MKKILLIIALLVVLIGAVAVFLLARNLGSIVRRGTERVLSYVLQVDVSIDSAEVYAREGRIVFSGVDIANPPGFKKPRAMRLGRIEAA